jgi:hypothetical protein
MKTGILNPERRIKAFTLLGEVMLNGASGTSTGHAGRFAQLIDTNYLSNPWFTPDNVRHAVSAIAGALASEKMHRWLSAYPEICDEHEPVTVGVVMAGNIPLVGFHDLLCVLVTGNRLQARLSTKDELLMRTVVSTLTALEPGFNPFIELTAERLKGFDMVIATGSNNTSRYFEYYFRNVPSIIRRNRNSIAIIDGTETDRELELLGDDIFSYFGLGCRNVSKIYVPAGYDITGLSSHWQKYGSLLSHRKYTVNYDHNKAVATVNREPFTDAGFVLLRETASLIAPMAVLNYEYYNDPIAVSNEVKRLGDDVQCVAGHGHLPFGTTQEPELWDYADNTDTIRFLQKKN